MKIGQPADKPAANGAHGAHGANAPKAAANPPAGPSPAVTTPKTDAASANIRLSSTATNLLSGSSQPEFDAEKVGRISKAIEGGSFKINPEAIADKLISNARELLGKVPT